MQDLVIRISRDVYTYVLDITVNFMLNKRKSGWGFAPDPTGGAVSAPPDPLAVTGGGTLLPR